MLRFKCLWTTLGLSSYPNYIARQLATCPGCIKLQIKRIFSDPVHRYSGCRASSLSRSFLYGQDRCTLLFRPRPTFSIQVRKSVSLHLHWEKHLDECERHHDRNLEKVEDRSRRGYTEVTTETTLAALQIPVATPKVCCTEKSFSDFIPKPRARICVHGKFVHTTFWCCIWHKRGQS